MRWRGLMVLAMLLAVAGLVLAACGEDESTTTPSDEGTPVPGGTFSFESTAEPGGIANWTVYESQGWNINHQMFEGLVEYSLQSDGTMKTEPVLAESWDSPDGKVWTFKLAQGAMFAPPVDREVKAQDVVDSWDFNSDPNLGTNYTVFVMAAIEGTDDSGFREGKTISGLKVIDDYTLQVTLKQPFYDFPVTLGHPIMYVQPVEYIKQVGVKKYALKPEGGTGPFMIKEWKSEQYIDLVRNPDWWRSEAQGGGPYLDAIHMQRYQSENSAWLDFQTGTIDWAGVPPGQVAAAQNNPKVKDGTWSAKAWPELSIMYTNINMEEPTIGGDQGLKIRQALAYAADNEAIINIVREGVPTTATGFVPAGIPGAGIAKTPYTYDLEQAKSLVAEIGTIPTLNYWMETNSETATKIAEALQAGWKDAGIDVKITALRVEQAQRDAAQPGARRPDRVLGLAGRLPADGRLPLPDVLQHAEGPERLFVLHEPGVRRPDRRGARDGRRSAAAEPVRPGREADPRRRRGHPDVLGPRLPRLELDARGWPGVHADGHLRPLGRVGQIGAVVRGLGAAYTL